MRKLLLACLVLLPAASGADTAVWPPPGAEGGASNEPLALPSLSPSLDPSTLA